MRTIPALAVLFTLSGPALAEEEVIPSHTFAEVYAGWHDMIGGRVFVTGGFVAQAGKDKNYAVLTDGKTSAVLELDTSKAINPDAVKALEAKCSGFFTDEVPECRADVVATILKNPVMDFPILAEPNFIAP